MAVWGLVWQSGRPALDPALTCARMQPVARAWPARATNGAPREAHELHRSPAGGHDGDLEKRVEVLELVSDQGVAGLMIGGKLGFAPAPHPALALGPEHDAVD